MNKVILTGRLVRDPFIKYNQGENPMCIVKFALAVNRRKKEGDATADFISCVAFGKQAKFFEEYAHKGIKFEIVGRLCTGSYKKDGKTVYTTDVVVEEAFFAESKTAISSSNPGNTNNAEPYMHSANDDTLGWDNLSDSIDSILEWDAMVDA